MYVHVCTCIPISLTPRPLPTRERRTWCTLTAHAPIRIQSLDTSYIAMKIKYAVSYLHVFKIIHHLVLPAWLRTYGHGNKEYVQVIGRPAKKRC